MQQHIGPPIVGDDEAEALGDTSNHLMAPATSTTSRAASPSARPRCHADGLRAIAIG